MLKNLLTVMLSTTLAFTAFAQKTSPPQTRTCGTGILPNDFETWLSNYQSTQFSANAHGAQVAYTIPVIIHVIHNGEAVGSGSNISNAQALSQITVLNQDFKKMNADTTLIPNVWKSIAANCEITFCLAQVDPNGNPLSEPGVNRINRNTAGFTAPPYGQTYIDNTIKPATIWNPNQYLNMWCMSLSGGLLGYATFPAPGTSGLSGLPAPYGSTTTDGVVILNTAFGNTGTAAAPYNKGRTAVHEIGHWLGLRHIWGDGNCLTDYCNDTPPASASNGGCPTFPHNSGSCTGNSPNGEMFMNYMDYVNDACMYMFTADQKTRMHAIITGNTMRNALVNSTKCNLPFSLDAGIQSIVNPATGSSFCLNSITPTVTLMNFGSTTLTSCTITYTLDGGAPQTFNWTGSLASSASTVVTLPAITGLTVASHTYTATSSAPNGGTDQNNANNTATSTFTVTTAPAGQALPFTEGFQGTTFVPTGWSYTPPNPPTNQWTRSTAAGGFGTSTASAKMDNFSGSVDITGQRDIMRTPALSFASANSSLKLKFDVAYARYDNSTNDTLNVWISTDCGGTWTKVYTKGGATLATRTNTTTAFTPTATQWRTDSVSLASYAGQSSVYMRFENVSNWGNNLYLDNINISFTASGAAPVANFTSASLKCSGKSIAFTDASTNSPTSWSWVSNPSSGVIITSPTSQNPTMTFANAGTYTVSLTATNSNGSNTTSQVITVSASPTVAATSQTVCAGASATITASGASTYSWNTGSTTAGITVTPTVTTTYTVTGTAANTCTNTATSTVTVNALPNVSANSSTVCAGASASITASGASSYSWNTGASTATISVTPTTTTTYTVTGTGSNGCTNTATSTVTVNALPNVTANSPTVCAGTAASLTAAGASTYSWNTGGTTATISVTPTVTTTYTVTGTAANGCTKTATSTVTVNALPNVTANSPTVCAGTAASLTAAGASTYSWNTGGTTATISVTPTVTTTYTVTGTGTNGCTKTVTSTVTVNALPNVTANSPTVCAGTAASLTAAGASTYSWNTGASTATISVTPTVTTTYTVTGTGANGCTKTATSTVTVNALPNVTANSSTVCAGAAATVSASGASTYSWNTGGTTSSISVSPTVTTTYTVTGTSSGCSNTATATVTVNSLPSVSATSQTVCAGSSATVSASGANTYVWSNGTNTSSNTVSPTATTAYTVTGTATNGCSSTAISTVTVNSLPVISVTSQTVCTGNPATLSATGASTYSWNTGATTASVTVSPASTTTYTVSGTDANGCTSSQTATVTVVSQPTVTANNAVSCEGSPVTLTASGANNYNWSNGASTSSIIVTPAVTTTYTVIGSSGAGCSDTVAVTVTVNPMPTVVASSDAAGDSICSGEAVTLSGAGASTYTWSNGINDGVSFMPTSTQTYTVTGTSADGCSNTSTITITVNACLSVYDVTATAFEIYPNPSKDLIFIKFTNADGNRILEVIDVQGKLVQKQNVKSNQLTINVNSFAEGVYSVRVSDLNGVSARTIIVQK